MNNIHKVIKIIFCLSQLIPLGITQDKPIVNDNTIVQLSPKLEAAKLEHELEARLAAVHPHLYPHLHPHHYPHKPITHIKKPHNIEWVPVLRDANGGENEDVHPLQTLQVKSNEQNEQFGNENVKSNNEQFVESIRSNDQQMKFTEFEKQPIVFVLNSCHNPQISRKSGNQERVIVEEIPAEFISWDQFKNSVDEKDFQFALNNNQAHILMIPESRNKILQNEKLFGLSNSQNNDAKNDQFINRHFVLTNDRVNSFDSQSITDDNLHQLEESNIGQQKSNQFETNFDSIRNLGVQNQIALNKQSSVISQTASKQGNFNFNDFGHTSNQNHANVLSSSTFGTHSTHVGSSEQTKFISGHTSNQNHANLHSSSTFGTHSAHLGSTEQTKFSSGPNTHNFFNNFEFSQNANNKKNSHATGFHPLPKEVEILQNEDATRSSNVASTEQTYIPTTEQVQFTSGISSQNSNNNFNIPHSIQRDDNIFTHLTTQQNPSPLQSSNIPPTEPSQFISQTSPQNFKNGFESSRIDPNNGKIMSHAGAYQPTGKQMGNIKEQPQWNMANGIENHPRFSSETSDVNRQFNGNNFEKSSNILDETNAQSQTQTIITNSDIILPLENENFPTNIHGSLPSTSTINTAQQITQTGHVIAPIHVVPQQMHSNFEIKHVPHITPIHVVHPSAYDSIYRDDEDDLNDDERTATIIKNRIWSNQYISPSRFIPPFVTHDVFGSPTSTFAQASATTSNFNGGGFIPQNTFGSSSSFAQASSGGTSGFNVFREADEKEANENILSSPYVIQVPPFPNPYFRRMAKRSIDENITSNSLIPIVKSLENILGNETDTIKRPIENFKKFLEKYPISEKIKFEETNDDDSLFKSEFSAQLPTDLLSFLEEPNVNRSKRTLALLHLLTAPVPTYLNSHIKDPSLARQTPNLPYYHLRNAIGSARKAAASAIENPLLGLVLVPNQNFEVMDTNGISEKSQRDSNEEKEIITQPQMFTSYPNIIIPRRRSFLAFQNIPVSPMLETTNTIEENRSATPSEFQKNQPVMLIRPVSSRRWSTPFASKKIILVAEPINPQQIVRTSFMSNNKPNTQNERKSKEETLPNTTTIASVEKTNRNSEIADNDNNRAIDPIIQFDGSSTTNPILPETLTTVESKFDQHNNAKSLNINNSVENTIDDNNSSLNEKHKEKLSKENAERVGTSLEYTPIMKTPFAGLATREQIRQFYSKYNPNASIII